MRIPDPGPFGDTFFEARLRAMVAALFVNNPFGGCVESLVTVRTHLFCFPLPLRVDLFPFALRDDFRAGIGLPSLIASSDDRFKPRSSPRPRLPSI